MALLSCNIIIEGYWREMNRQFLPNYSGIFFVYLAFYDVTKDVVTPKELIFIGQAPKIREQVQFQTKEDNPWHKFAKEGYEFCFSAAYVSILDMERVLSAFVFQFKPPANIHYTDVFTYEPTTITATGKTALLKSNFIVQKSLYE